MATTTAAAAAAATASLYGTIAVKAPTKRFDGRQSNQLRPIDSYSHELSRSNGSVKYSQGKTTLLVAIHGPVACSNVRDEKYDRCSVTVSFRHVSGSVTSSDYDLQQSLAAVFSRVILLSQYPRANISIAIQVIHNDGSIISAAINAVMMALLDAGIHCQTMIAAVTVAIDQLADKSSISNNDSTDIAMTGNSSQQRKLILDPITTEHNAASAVVNLAFTTALPVLSSSATATTASTDTDTPQQPQQLLQLAFSDTTGVISESNYFSCVELSRFAARHVLSYIKITHQKRIEAINK